MGTYLDLSSARIWYEDRGSGAPVVLLHGGLSDGRMFHDNLATLADRFRLLQPDLRGHGRSPDVPGPWGPPELAADLVELMEKTSGPAKLVGYSLGATVALLVAIHRPDLVERLVLISGVFHHRGWLMPPSADRGVPPVLAQLYAQVSPHEPEHIQVILGKLADSAGTQPALTNADLRRVRCRALVLVSDDDLVDHAHSYTLYQQLPDAELAVVPGTSHNLLLEKPQLCTRLVGGVSARRSGPDPHADPATAGHPARRASMTPPTWEQARARWAEVNTYWLSTVRPDGRPHAVPLLGVWVADTFHFAAGDRTRKARNLAGNPACVVTAATPELDLVLEGRAAPVRDEERVRAVAAAYREKYGWEPQVRQGQLWAEGAPTAGPPPYTVYRLEPQLGFAFPTGTEFTPARWRF
ncbi:MAG TPA: alpha/beta fold hydrolase [Natronosporangium sp.]|nr:alpha/beta fold hydrolase [Natronosporangium sp.]